jgi:hypothetical protein
MISVGGFTEATCKFKSRVKVGENRRAPRLDDLKDMDILPVMDLRQNCENCFGSI